MMRLFKYKTILLLSLFGGLCASSIAYAITSTPTLGPSVGHRPVVTDLVLASPAGDITLAATALKPGDTIGLASVSGGSGNNSMDIDGDKDKAGAHCVWYRVDPNGISTVVKDPGPNDHNCTYTIQTGDIGHKIKNVITILSDQDVATQKGYMLNPIESLPVETISASAVGTVVLPFQYKGINERGGYLDVKSMAQFKTMIREGSFKLGDSIDALGYVQSMGADFVWTSSDPSSLDVNHGVVTVLKIPKGDVVIRAKNSSSGITYEYSVSRPQKWFASVWWEPSVTFPPTALPEAIDECLTRGRRLPKASELLDPSEGMAINGKLVNEWSFGHTTNGFSTGIFKSPIIVTSDPITSGKYMTYIDGSGIIDNSSVYPPNVKSVLCVEDL